MKKYLFLLITIFLITGCASKIKCSYTENSGNYEIINIGYFKGGKLSKIISENTLRYNTKNEAVVSCDSAKQFAKSQKNVKVECDGKTVKITQTKNNLKNKEKIKKDEYKSLMKQYKCN